MYEIIAKLVFFMEHDGGGAVQNDSTGRGTKSQQNPSSVNVKRLLGTSLKICNEMCYKFVRNI